MVLLAMQAGSRAKHFTSDETSNVSRWHGDSKGTVTDGRAARARHGTTRPVARLMKTPVFALIQDRRLAAEAQTGTVVLTC